jgi:GT2 family glycosyltransferase
MKLSIIILSYNTKDLTLQCLKSIYSNPLSPALGSQEVIVVDNASTDGSSEAINKTYPQVIFIQSSTNKGFAGGNNLGFKIAKGEYWLVLNSDTELYQGCLDKLIDFMDQHPKVGALTPRVELTDGRLDLACHRGMPTPWNALTYFLNLEKLFPGLPIFSGYHQLYQNFTKPHKIDATAATAMIVRQKTIDEIGVLDEQFFLYGEDLDWCKRITDAGWEIWYYPEAKVLHYKSASGKKKQKNEAVRQKSINYFYDTMKQFYEKHYQKKYPRWLRQLVYWGIDIKKKYAR